ncbi:hypothetical protein V6N11_072047 [Hibiscus sabdariffa]|uniref:Uncharacterized protein n=1 Tax=Hibiscus sabdariffa TaxID=183260 RepID=A0ABR2U1V3_9ROSI
MSDRKKIGLGLTAFGVFFSFLGIIFFFDKGLLAMGNILFISGVTLTIGLKSTMQFFMKRQNFKGTISFFVGFFFVVIGWPILGMILEAYGFIVLFSGFWPTLAVNHLSDRGWTETRASGYLCNPTHEKVEQVGSLDDLKFMLYELGKYCDRRNRKKNTTAVILSKLDLSNQVLFAEPEPYTELS